MEDKKYLEIYPSEVAAKKILNHLDKLLKDKPKVYRKTIQRYKKLGEVLSQCLDRINKFIEFEALSSSSDAEFSELTTPASESSNTTSMQPCSEYLHSNTTSTNSPQNSFKLAQYSSTLELGSNTDFGYEQVNQCAKMINQWFQARIPSNSKVSDFRYNLDQIPLWISHIVITYGYYLETNQLDLLKSEFDVWCEDVQKDPHNTYRLPYHVYHTNISNKSECYTLSAVLIYDLLIEKCYFPLIEIANMDPNQVLTTVKQNNAGLAGAIRYRISKQGELLDTLGFIKTSGGEN